MMSRALLLTIVITAIPSCIAANGVGGSTGELDEFNGESLNGESLNGESLNGESLNGESLNGPNPGMFTVWTSLDNVFLNNDRLDSLSLAGTVFTGVRDGESFTGAAIVGAKFWAKRGDNHWVMLRISGARPPTAPSTAWFYFVDYFESDGHWYPTCKTNTQVLASVPLNGTWDHNLGQPGGGSHIADASKFTWACEKTGALAKCVVNGYEPWSTANGTSLADYHQACVRLLRADYCGDGRSYTTNGRLLNLYDALGIQNDTDTWGIEAEWTATGAACVTDHHRASVDIPCRNPEADAQCGELEHFTAGTLLMNELP